MKSDNGMSQKSKITWKKEHKMEKEWEKNEISVQNKYLVVSS